MSKKQQEKEYLEKQIRVEEFFKKINEGKYKEAIEFR